MSKFKINRIILKVTGTIIDASKVVSVKLKNGKTRTQAVLHIQNSDADGCQELAIRVTDELCNYVGCIGMKVAVDYAVRVFKRKKDNIDTLNNDIYATCITAIKS